MSSWNGLIDMWGIKGTDKILVQIAVYTTIFLTCNICFNCTETRLSWSSVLKQNNACCLTWFVRLINMRWEKPFSLDRGKKSSKGSLPCVCLCPSGPSLWLCDVGHHRGVILLHGDCSNASFQETVSVHLWYWKQCSSTCLIYQKICAQKTKEQKDWHMQLKLYYLHAQVQVLSKQEIFKSWKF